MADFLNQFADASGNRELKQYGKQTAETLETLAAGKGLGERNVPVGIKAADRSARIEQMKIRQAELQGEAKQQNPDIS
ncbi:MAG: hypothetical protein K5772_04985 [Clostridia bacterium]|nr:hypothetical protein [Clostridia bacterium]